MASQHLTNPAPIAQIFITLSDNSIAVVPEDADPDAFRRYCEARIKLAANPRKRQRAFSRSSKPGRKINYAERVLAAGHFDAGTEATARRMDQLAAIADEDTFVSGIEWDLPFMGEPVVYESEADDYGLQPVW